jgi:hypothetical protein
MEKGDIMRTGFLRRRLIVAAMLFLAGSAGSCRFVALEDKGTPPLEQLEIGKAEISNWQPEAEMKIYIGTELFDYNNGGAPKYLDKGCLKTGVQRLNGQNSAIVDVMVMDFGTGDNATAMFKEIQMNNVGSSINDPVYPDTTVSVISVLGGVSGVARFANFYIEMSVTGFSDQVLALKTFDMVLGLYAKKIGE